MKRYFSTIGYCMTPFVISYAFWYVIGAGISASWDTANWTMDLKIVLTVWAGCFAFMMFYRLQKENK